MLFVGGGVFFNSRGMAPGDRLKITLIITIIAAVGSAVIFIAEGIPGLEGDREFGYITVVGASCSMGLF